MDLNADLGEGFGRWTLGDDEALLDVVTSANVACGFHAGDPSIMQRVCAAAAERGVTIGAQVGYRDLVGFGRRFVDVEPGDLRADVIYQIGALEAFAKVAGTRVAYVKPHGALYNAVFSYERQAEAVVAARSARTTRISSCSASPDRPAPAASPRAGCAWSARRSPTGPTSRTGRSSIGGRNGAVLHDEDEVTGRAVTLAISGYAVRGRRIAGDGRGWLDLRARRHRRGSTPWSAPSARRSSTQTSTSRRSSDEAAPVR